MSFRHTQIMTIKYGHFGEYLAMVNKLEEIAKARGWSPSRVLVPTVGKSNEITIENEYADLATFQRENDAFYEDPEAFELYRAGSQFVVEGSAHTVMYEDVPMSFPGAE
jgi:hypothetical protein